MSPWATGPGAAQIADQAGTGLPSRDTAQDPSSGDYPGGEEAAKDRLEDFLGRIDDYLDTRDLPAIDGTSRLSADLRFGTLSPREIAAVVGETTAGRRGFVRQLGMARLVRPPALPKPHHARRCNQT